MKILYQCEGKRLQAGWHTGFEIIKKGNKYYMSTKFLAFTISKKQADKLIKD